MYCLPCVSEYRPYLELDPGGSTVDIDFLAVTPFHPSKLLLGRGSRVFKMSIESADHLVNRVLHVSLYQLALILPDYRHTKHMTLSENANVNKCAVAAMPHHVGYQCLSFGENIVKLFKIVDNTFLNWPRFVRHVGQR